MEGDEDVEEVYDDMIPPYSPSGSNAVASMSNAIKIVNRYMLFLNHFFVDFFTQRH